MIKLRILAALRHCAFPQSCTFMTKILSKPEHFDTSLLRFFLSAFIVTLLTSKLMNFSSVNVRENRCRRPAVSAHFTSQSKTIAAVKPKARSEFDCCGRSSRWRSGAVRVSVFANAYAITQKQFKSKYQRNKLKTRP